MDPVLDTVASQCLAVRMRILSRAITAIYEEEMHSIGITVGQGNILVVVGRLEVARPQRVCEILQMDTSTFSRNIRRLIDNGWLEVVPDDDRRSQPLKLTRSGLALIRKSLPAWQRAQRRAAKLLGDEGVAALHGVTRKLMAGQAES